MYNFLAIDPAVKSTFVTGFTYFSTRLNKLISLEVQKIYTIVNLEIRQINETNVLIFSSLFYSLSPVTKSGGLPDTGQSFFFFSKKLLDKLA